MKDCFPILNNKEKEKSIYLKQETDFKVEKGIYSSVVGPTAIQRAHSRSLLASYLFLSRRWWCVSPEKLVRIRTLSCSIG